MIAKGLNWVRGSALVRRERPMGSIWQAIGWWEARRLAFNVVVGSAGVVTCFVMLGVGLTFELMGQEPLGLPDPIAFAIIPIVGYGIMANVCYTGGWIVEILARQAWPSEADQLATLSLTLGAVFSVLLTLAPAALTLVLALVAGIVQVVSAVLS